MRVLLVKALGVKCLTVFCLWVSFDSCVGREGGKKLIFLCNEIMFLIVDK